MSTYVASAETVDLRLGSVVFEFGCSTIQAQTPAQTASEVLPHRASALALRPGPRSVAATCPRRGYCRIDRLRVGVPLAAYEHGK